jgi:hypothetical protein
MPDKRAEVGNANGWSSHAFGPDRITALRIKRPDCTADDKWMERELSFSRVAAVALESPSLPQA